MKLGQQALEALQAEITGKIYPGDDLVVAGETGISGTLELICREWDKLRTYFSESFLRMGVETLKNCMISEEDVFWKEAGFSALYFTEEGGILSGLWKMAEASGVGLEVDLRSVPIRQETIEICEYFDVNPYYLYSAGALLVGTEHGEALVSHLAAQGIFAAVIGRATGGKDRVIRNGEECRYLDRPKQDEWYRRLEYERANINVSGKEQ